MIKTLNKEEYILKAAKLCGVEKVEIKALEEHLSGKMVNPYIERRNSNLFKLYEMYVNERYRALKVGKNGIIDLNKTDFVTSKKRTEKNKFGKHLIVTPELDSYIAVSPIPYDVPIKFEQIAELNNLLLPHISKKLGVPATEYYRSIYREKTTENANHLTKNFLNDDEILIPGNKIFRGDNKRKPKVTKRKIKLESRLEHTDKFIKRNYEAEKFSKEECNAIREEIRKGLIKQTVVNKFFVIDDEPSSSFGLIKNKEGRLRLAPLSKFSYCAGVTRNASDLKHIVTSTGKEDLQSFILEYGKETWFREWIESKLLKLDFEECVQSMESASKVSLSETEKDYYKYFFENMKEDVKEVVRAKYNKDKLPKRRKRDSTTVVMKKGFQKDLKKENLQKNSLLQKLKSKHKNIVQKESEDIEK